MNETELVKTLKKGEGISIEFKACKGALSRDVFETVCAFLNRAGGELFIGVDAGGKMTGVDSQAVEQIKKDFVTAMNNPQKINPAFYLSIEEVQSRGKSTLYVFVPESSQVHRCSGRIYDRNEDGDFDITDNTNLVTALYLRKQTTYSENKVFPYLRMRDFRPDLFARARKLAVNQKSDHPWVKMTDEELLKSSQMYLKDWQTGKEGFTLASALIFGKDDTILSVLPHHRTDAILRQINLDRYDDRDDIRTNLMDSYERLLAFVQKHLSDPFYLEGTTRISLRDQIFREVIGNLLIHREFLNAFPAKLIIEQDQVVTENSNRPHGHGLINPNHFSPYPKNPVIARFFKQIGWADELGSGVRKLFRYSKHYGGKPVLEEGDIFRAIIPLNKADIKGPVTPQVTTEVGTKPGLSRDQVGTRLGLSQDQVDILRKCMKDIGINELMEISGRSNRSKFRDLVLNPLLKEELITMTIPEKPTSSKQCYRLTDKGKNYLKEMKK